MSQLEFDNKIEIQFITVDITRRENNERTSTELT